MTTVVAGASDTSNERRVAVTTSVSSAWNSTSSTTGSELRALGEPGVYVFIAPPSAEELTALGASPGPTKLTEPLTPESGKVCVTGASGFIGSTAAGVFAELIG